MDPGDNCNSCYETEQHRVLSEVSSGVYECICKTNYVEESGNTDNCICQTTSGWYLDNDDCY